MNNGARIKRLSRPAATRLRSSLVIPSLPQILTELAHNALDAGATSIECWVRLVPGDESVRLEDDGHGITLENLGFIGEQYITSKEAEGWSGNGTYGYRGEALASISALSLMEITSRAPGAETHSKIIRNGETIYLGKARHELGRARGTTVSVRDLFNAIPVRRASLASTPSISACKQAMEALVLVAPKIRWVLWEDRLGGMRKILHWAGGKNSLEAFRGLYGHAGVERVQKIRVSSGDRRMDGFISLEGAFTKSHQHLYINGYAIPGSELHKLIERRFASSSFSALSSNLTEESVAPTQKRSSPRRLERFPIYVLNITLPSADVDAAYDARKLTIGCKEPGKTRAFVIAVIDDFLRKSGFGAPRSGTDSPTRQNLPMPSPSKPFSPRPSGLSSTIVPDEAEPETVPNPARQLFFNSYRLGSEAPSTLAAPSPATPSPIASGNGDNVPPAGISAPSPPELEPSTVEELIKQASDQVISRVRKFDERQDDERTTYAPSWLPPVRSDMKFTHASIASAIVLPQVDRRFIPCVMMAEDTSEEKSEALVVIDQHAADERVAVEQILDALNEGFARNNMAITELEDGVVRVVLSRQEVATLELPGVREVLRRWGIGLGDTAAQGEYTQVNALCVPQLLDRLGHKNATELTRLLRLYLPELADSLPEIQVLTTLLDCGSRDGSHGWASVQRRMPLEMAELANSKACRGAIMFGDRLQGDQCERLVAQLAVTRNPWICAHGRPTLAPLGLIPQYRPPARRAIDWAAWKHKHTEPPLSALRPS
ncbi:hypothetical protein CC85DRAFT_325650 [Cutaneotrichosporon oleaginosum]|uniref:MutL C-terminal dimerisation domain-containing protein n=1 Tax=Cutaneotrichosporon oleaginosum TaxID=879819 RepID=A0A0J0XWV3_9TREE|nr:uncharacterized protein CC85DRAFT_325650 [Cutaneotrichosporon oleaginosum]KLT45528.1 hypothetical protein CC85DRAFT_325650 [Cutaneotrichosporon oleaginosum]TXT14518.1 hypothetical protein COLE_00711 [Cutaneotrichosporon oleaginosum]